jgi:hypothetical protein
VRQTSSMVFDHMSPPRYCDTCAAFRTRRNGRVRPSGGSGEQTAGRKLGAREGRSPFAGGEVLHGHCISCGYWRGGEPNRAERCEVIRHGRCCNPLRELRADYTGVGWINGKGAVPVPGGMNHQSGSAHRREADRLRMNGFYHRAREQVQAEQYPCCGPAPSLGQGFR